MVRKRLNLKVKKTKIDQTVLILDGKYLVYRNQYSKNMGELSYDGIKTGLYYGFFNSIKMLTKKFNPHNIVIMWDVEGSKRKKEFSGYKDRNNLKYLKEEQIIVLQEMHKEYPNLIQMCDDLGYQSYSMEGYEADDFIALFTQQFKYNNIIVTRDEDMYQCINNYTFIYDIEKKLKKDLNWFRRTYDIEPEQWALIKAWAGCKSDTIPGIPGVAEKTAIKILKGDPKAVQKLKNYEEKEYDKLQLWKRLTILPHPELKRLKLEYKQSNLNIDYFLEMCQNFNFRSFLETINEFKLTEA